MKTFFILSATALTLFASCGDSQFPGYTKHDSGLYYRFHNDADSGSTPVKGDYLILDISYQNENDSVFMSSYDSGEPIIFPFPGEEHPGDLYSGIGMMTPGDSATFILLADSFFAQTVQQPLPHFLTAGEMIKVNIVLKDVRSAEEMQAMELERMRMEQEMSKERDEEEKLIIEEYLSSNNLKGETRPSGLVYVETKKGSGKQAAAGNKVKVNYTGRLLDGTVFDTSREDEARKAGIHNPQRTYEPHQFVLGRGEVIMGWDEGITLLREGGRAKLIIPSLMGYGPRPTGPIPPNSILIFDVELVEVVQ